MSLGFLGDLDKSKASGVDVSLMDGFNDGPGTERCSSASFQAHI